MLKHITGMNAKQIKDGKKHGSLDILSSDQLEHYQRIEHLAIILLINQVSYEMIKAYMKGVFNEKANEF